MKGRIRDGQCRSQKAECRMGAGSRKRRRRRRTRTEDRGWRMAEMQCRSQIAECRTSEKRTRSERCPEMPGYVRRRHAKSEKRTQAKTPAWSLERPRTCYPVQPDATRRYRMLPQIRSEKTNPTRLL